MRGELGYSIHRDLDVPHALYSLPGGSFRSNRGSDLFPRRAPAGSGRRRGRARRPWRQALRGGYHCSQWTAINGDSGPIMSGCPIVVDGCVPIFVVRRAPSAKREDSEISEKLQIGLLATFLASQTD